MTHSTSSLALGIDIGGTSAKLALVTRNGHILARTTVSTSDRRDEHDFFQALFLAIETVLEKAGGKPQLLGIGAGAPSANELDGSIENAANLPFSPKVEFVKTMQAHFQVPVFLVKDSNASTLGEWHYGAAKGMRHFVLLTLGTGLGAGIVSGGRLLAGASGHAGEVGHIVAVPEGRRCGCGRRGCVETYVSATGLRRTVAELMAKSMTVSVLRKASFEELSAKGIAEAALAGDRLALAAFAETGEVLGRVLADLAALFDPEAFFLSGGLAAAGPLLLQPTSESMERHLLTFFKGKIQVAPSALGENDAALLGTASLVFQNVHETP